MNRRPIQHKNVTDHQKPAGNRKLHGYSEICCIVYPFRDGVPHRCAPLINTTETYNRVSIAKIGLCKNGGNGTCEYVPPCFSTPKLGAFQVFFIPELESVSIKLRDYLEIVQSSIEIVGAKFIVGNQVGRAEAPLNFETFSEEVGDCLGTHGRPGRGKEAELVASEGGAGLARIKHD